MTEKKWITDRGSVITIENNILTIVNTKINLSDDLEVSLIPTEYCEILVQVHNKTNDTIIHAGRYSYLETACSLGHAIQSGPIDQSKIWAQKNKQFIERWQPIETAPKDGTKILLCALKSISNLRINLDFPIIETDYYHSIQNGNTFEGWGKFNEYLYPPTHWIPLPKPPGDNK